jgi:long-chain acyl-CoA synthetase
MLFSGAHLKIRDGFVPRRILQDLSQLDVSIFLGVPSMYQIFVETLLPDIPDLSHVRYLLSCTAPLRPDLITAFHEKFRMPICQHYGSSETGAVTNHMPWAVLDRMNSVGRPLSNVQVQIQDSNGQLVPVGSEGEVVVKSRVVAPGYIMGEPPGESKFKGDTYRTGDLGIVDEDGFLHLTGRKDGVINVGGFKVSPYEVTQVLEHFPAVREAGVIGVKDSLGEEVVYAAVTLISPATENDILAFCRSRLSDYKVPRGIKIMDEMPRGPSGKIKLTQEDVGL